MVNGNTSTAHKEREQLGDRRSDGESSCNSGDGTGQMAQPWMFMMMMMIMVKYHIPLQSKMQIFKEMSSVRTELCYMQLETDEREDKLKNKYRDRCTAEETGMTNRSLYAIFLG